MSLSVVDGVLTIEEGPYLNATVDLSSLTAFYRISTLCFQGATSLQAITIPSTVTVIEEGSFSGCSVLSNVQFQTVTQLSTIGVGMFYNCASLQTINLPNTINTISDYAFNASGLLTITLPSSLTSVGADIFANCGSLSTVQFQEGARLSTIGQGMFALCPNLKTINLPNTTVTLLDQSFSNSGFINITLPSSLTNMGDNIFQASPFSAVSFDTGIQITTLGSNKAFGNCTTLFSIDLPESLEIIDSQAFVQAGLKHINIKDSVREINFQAFYEVALSEVTLPSSLTSLGTQAFNLCASLSTVRFKQGSHLSTIYDQAFLNTGLTSIVLPNSLAEFGLNVFVNTALTTITLPNSISSFRGEDKGSGPEGNLFYNVPLQSINLRSSFTNFNLLTQVNMGVPSSIMSTIYTFGVNPNDTTGCEYEIVNFLANPCQGAAQFKSIVRSTDLQLPMSTFDASYLVEHTNNPELFTNANLTAIGCIDQTVLPTSYLPVITNSIAYLPINVNESVTFTNASSTYQITSIGVSTLALTTSNPVLNSVCLAGGSGGNTLARSTDGKSWTPINNTIFTAVYAIAWNGTIWLAGGTGTSTIARSTDGISWTASSSVIDTTVYTIAWNGTLWLAGGIDTTEKTIAYSSDGINWYNTLVTGNVLSGACCCIAWNGVRWLAGGYTGGLGRSSNIIKSDNGQDWSSTTNGSGLFGNGTNVQNFGTYCLAWNGQLWVAGGSSTNTIAYSYDGLYWYYSNQNYFPYDDGTCDSVAWNGLLWVAIGSTTPQMGGATFILSYSYDAINWFNSVNGTFIFDGNSFTNRKSVTWNGSVWVAGGNGLNQLAYSYDGKSWTASASGNLTFQTACLAVASRNVLPLTQRSPTYSLNSTLTINNNPYVFIGTGSIFLQYTEEEIIWQVQDGIFSFLSTGYDLTTFDLVAANAISNFWNISSVCFGPGWPNLEQITIPASVSTIGAGAFTGCTNLSTVTFQPNSILKYIEASAFSYTSALTSVTVPSTLTSIGANAFEYSMIHTLTIPVNSQLTNIGNDAFNATNLTSITLPDSLETLGTDVFSASLLKTINVTSTFNQFAIFTEANVGIESSILSTIYTFGQNTNTRPSPFAYSTVNFLLAPPSNPTDFKDVIQTTQEPLTFSNFDASFLVQQSYSNLPATFFSTTTTVTIGATNLSVIPLVDIPQATSTLVYLPIAVNESVTFTNETTNYNLTITNTSTITVVQKPGNITQSYPFGRAFLMNGSAYRFIASGSAIFEVVNYWQVQNGIFSIIDGPYTDTTVDLINLNQTSNFWNISSSCFGNSTIGLAWPNLSYITIPSTVSTIGSYAFGNCVDLSMLSFQQGSILQTIKDYAFYNCDINDLDFVSTSKLSTIGVSAFESNTTLSTIHFPSSLVIIDSFAFSGCTNLSSFTLPMNEEGYPLPNNKLNRINDKAFASCSLYDVLLEFANVLSSISSQAFLNNTSINQFTLPSSLTTIAGNAFQGCAMNGLGFKENSQYTDSDGFSTFIQPLATSLNSIYLPSLTNIKAFLFENFGNLTEVSFNNVTTTIEESAFKNVSSLTSIYIPNIQSIGQNAFRNCLSLNSVNIATNTISTLNVSVFESCSSLQNITLPYSITKLDDHVFKNAGLKSIFLSDNVSTLGTGVFSNCPLTSILVSQNFDYFSIFTEPNVGITSSVMSTIYTSGENTNTRPELFAYSTINLFAAPPTDSNAFKDVVKASPQSLTFSNFDARFLYAYTYQNSNLFSNITLVCPSLGSAIPTTLNANTYFPTSIGDTFNFEFNQQGYNIEQTGISTIFLIDNDTSYSLGDLFQIGGRNFRYSAAGSFGLEGPYAQPCLLEGTRVKTPRGYIPIELIKEGDTIISHCNLVKKVTRVGKWDCVYEGHTLAQTMYKVNKGTYGAKKDVYLSHFHKISDGKMLLLPTTLGLEKAKPEEYVRNGKFTLYHLQVPNGLVNHLVVNGDCVVDSWT